MIENTKAIILNHFNGIKEKYTSIINGELLQETKEKYANTVFIVGERGAEMELQFLEMMQ